MERFDPCKTRACKQRCDSYGVACEDICIDEIERLRSAIKQTLDENGHLADGENCTLIVLKRALTPNAEVRGDAPLAQRPVEADRPERT